MKTNCKPSSPDRISSTTSLSPTWNRTTSPCGLTTAFSLWSATMTTMVTRENALALPEFDQYAHSYADYLDDPLRGRFASDPLHFHRRKWLLIQRLLKRAGMDPARSRWLDVGCGQGSLLEVAGKHF